MAIAFRGAASGTAANGANITIDLTTISGLAENDFVIVAYVIGDSTDETGTIIGYIAGGAPEPGGAGWTQIGDAQYSNDVSDNTMIVFGKFMGPSVDTSLVLTGDAAANNSGAAVAMAFSGVDRTRPLDVTPTMASGINTVLPDPPAITPTTTGAAVVAVGAGGHIRGLSKTYSGPTGYTTNFTSVGSNDVNDCSVGVGYNLSPNIGSAENPGAFTFSDADSTDYSWTAMSIALRPSETPAGIYLVGSVSGTSVNGADITLTLPAGTAENDLVIVAQAMGRTTDEDMLMTTSGYTEVADLYASDTFDINLGVFYKKMGSTPDTTAVTDGNGTAGDSYAAVAMVFRHVDTNTPMDATATTATGLNSGNADPPSIDYTDTNALIVAVGGLAHNLGDAGAYIFPKHYFGIMASKNGTFDAAVAMAIKGSYLASDPEDPPRFNEPQSTAGGTSPKVDTSNSWAAVTMALRKAVATSIQPVLILVGI